MAGWLGWLLRKQGRKEGRKEAGNQGCSLSFRLAVIVRRSSFVVGFFFSPCFISPLIILRLYERVGLVVEGTVHLVAAHEAATLGGWGFGKEGS